MNAIMEKLAEFLVTYGMRIVGALLIMVIGILIAKIVRRMLVRILTGAKVEQTIVSFVASMTYVTLCVFVVIAALDKLGVKTTSVMAALGAAGLAVGLALQGALTNFAAGLLIVIFKPFKVGDFIEAAGETGLVEHIEMLTTSLKTLDNKVVVVPNGKLTAENIINYTAKGIRRVDLTAGASYGDDIEKVKAAVREVFAADPRILKEPAPFVGLVEMADSSLNYVVRPWCKTEDYWGVYFDTNEALKKKFDALGITIPFPQRDVHIISQPD